METCDLNLWNGGRYSAESRQMSMANSLELRVPFLDRKVFELASHIPTKCKVNANQTKIAMRGAAEKTIPAKTADKKSSASLFRYAPGCGMSSMRVLCARHLTPPPRISFSAQKS